MQFNLGLEPFFGLGSAAAVADQFYGIGRFLGKTLVERPVDSEHLFPVVVSGALPNDGAFLAAFGTNDVLRTVGINPEMTYMRGSLLRERGKRLGSLPGCLSSASMQSGAGDSAVAHHSCPEPLRTSYGFAECVRQVVELATPLRVLKTRQGVPTNGT